MSSPSQSPATKANDTTIRGYAPVNGIKMYYEIHGNKGGIPIVLIHGGGSTISSNWETMFPLLSKNYTLIAMELQAHGRTNDREAAESFEQDAADVAALLYHLKIEKANVVGFSNGGTTTLHLAINYPDIVNQIVVISANYKKEGMIAGFFDGFSNITLNDMPPPLKDAYLEVNPDEKGLLNMFTKDKERMLAFKNIPDDQLKTIGAPALLILGDQDVITIEHALEMSKLIPGARLAVLPGNHGSFIGEVCSKKENSKLPEATALLIKEFLE